MDATSLMGESFFFIIEIERERESGLSTEEMTEIFLGKVN